MRGGIERFGNKVGINGFKAGTSGNPGGRPSIAKAWEEATGKKTAALSAEALKLIWGVFIKGPKGEKDSNWTFAAQQVLHYLIGKPKEQIELTGALSPEGQALFEALKLTPHERRLAAEDATEDEDNAAELPDDGDNA